MNLNIINLGKMEYEKVLHIQETLQQKRIDEEIDDTLIVVEHLPVITMGKRGKDENILVPQEALDKEGIKIVWVGRGGDATCHGPGQMVGIMDGRSTQAQDRNDIRAQGVPDHQEPLRADPVTIQDVLIYGRVFIGNNFNRFKERIQT